MNKRNAILALLLLVPVPSLGVLAGMVVWPDTATGKAVFAVSKVWLFALPAVWFLLVEKGQLSLSPARKGGFGFAVASGLIISGIIVAAYWLLGDAFLDRRVLIEKMGLIGLSRPAVYLAGAAYWIGVNSVLEEYVWRWFVVRQCEALVKPMTAVVLSALFFTLHHVIAMKVYMPWTATVLCSAGIFIGGALWSWMYVKYESIWPGHVSHAMVDVCIFALGAWMIFR
jgi:hypothetical protein